jgi:hypothetical protein
VVEPPGNPRVPADRCRRAVAWCGWPAGAEWMICVPFVDGTLSMVLTIT